MTRSTAGAQLSFALCAAPMVIAAACAAEGPGEKRDAARIVEAGAPDAPRGDTGYPGHDTGTSEDIDATSPDTSDGRDAARPPPRWGWPPDAGDAGVCKYVLLFEFDDARGCVKDGRWSLEPCAYHAYGEDNIGASQNPAYCLVTPDGTLYHTRSMSSDMDVLTPGWTRSSDESTTLFPDTLSPTDTERCERLMAAILPESPDYPANLCAQLDGAP